MTNVFSHNLLHPHTISKIHKFDNEYHWISFEVHACKMYQFKQIDATLNSLVAKIYPFLALDSGSTEA